MPRLPLGRGPDDRPAVGRDLRDVVRGDERGSRLAAAVQVQHEREAAATRGERSGLKKRKFSLVPASSVNDMRVKSSTTGLRTRSLVIANGRAGSSTPRWSRTSAVWRIEYAPTSWCGAVAPSAATKLTEALASAGSSSRIEPPAASAGVRLRPVVRVDVGDGPRARRVGQRRGHGERRRRRRPHDEAAVELERDGDDAVARLREDMGDELGADDRRVGARRSSACATRSAPARPLSATSSARRFASPCSAPPCARPDLPVRTLHAVTDAVGTRRIRPARPPAGRPARAGSARR